MGDRSDYLIWREKNGLFTAMHKDGSIRTWSINTGKLVYTRKDEKPGFEKHKIYSANALEGNKDISGLMNWYQYPERSLSLVVGPSKPDGKVASND